MGQGILNVLKVVFSILLFPVVYVVATQFLPHLGSYPNDPKQFFVYGLLAYLLVFLFLYQFWGIYELGQKLMTQMFSFTAPIDKILIVCIPFYPTVILLLLCVVKNFLNQSQMVDYFIFFTGFSCAMHLLLTAQDLQEQEKSAFRPGYFFTITLVFICNIIIVILMFDLVYTQFTLGRFFEQHYERVIDIYRMIGRLVTQGKAGF